MKKFLILIVLSCIVFTNTASAYILNKVDTRIATNKVKVLNERIQKGTPYKTIYKQQLNIQNNIKKNRDSKSIQSVAYRNLDKNYAILQYILENLIDSTNKLITSNQLRVKTNNNCDNWWYYNVSIGTCQPNTTTRSCIINNGNGSQTWNGNSYWSCNVVSCNTGYTATNGSCIVKSQWDYCGSNQHIENDLCTSNTRTCTNQNWVWEQTWNGNIWLGCVVSQTNQSNQPTCSSSQHLESNICVSNSKSCSILNGAWEQTWNESSYWSCNVISCNTWYENKWGSTSCSLVVITSQYPWCNTPDITLWDKIWSACNVWSSIAGFWIESYGSYYQWGRNDTWFTITTESSPYDWQQANGNAWGDTTDTNVARQWPCAVGYHIPTQTEWMRAIEYSWWKYNTLVNTLKLSSAWWRGYDNAEYYWQGWSGFYWSSSPDLKLPKSYYMNIYTWNWSITGDFKNSSFRAVGYSVRCVKN